MTPANELPSAVCSSGAQDREPSPQLAASRARKPYLEPRLIVYGRLSDLTGFVGNDHFDGAIGSSQTS